ncbi:MAG: aldo/keto reductase [Gammaproteobacteria bacterium]|nr:MAG: aldo/keto reductase [Gammaproteobacteria bacterium]
MEEIVLGRTGLEVSRISLGGLFVSSYGAAFDQAREAVNRAVELGINYVDTAPMYGNSEEVLGRILPDLERPMIVSTKLGARPQPFDPRSAKALRESFEESCRLLGRETVDILMIHEPDRPRQFDWWEDFDAATGPVMGVLQALKEEGRIRFLGLGGTTAYEMARLLRTGKFDVVLTAFNYSLLWQEAAHELLPAAREHGVGVVVGSPLQQGALARRWDEVDAGARWLSKPRREQFRALYRLLDEIELPLPELALRFVLSNPDVHTVLSGVRSATEVEQNVAAAGRGPLSDGLLSRIAEIAAMVPFRPHDEPFALPFGRPYAGSPPAGPI